MPTSGTARVAGFDICKEPEKARGSLGFLSTATALYGLRFLANFEPGDDVGTRIVASIRSAVVFLSGTGLQFNVSPKAVIWVFVMVVPLAVLFSAALISLFAKSFKEAQSYLSPLTIVVIARAIVSILPGTGITSPRFSVHPAYTLRWPCGSPYGSFNAKMSCFGCEDVFARRI